jgi:signal transduction histidine kinase
MDLFHNSEYVYTNITAFKNGMANRSGYTIEPVNGVETFISYAPIHAISTNWVALSFQPYDKMFLLPNSLRSNALVMCIILAAGAAAVAFLTRRTFHAVDKHAQEILLKDQQLQKYYDELITVNMAKEEFMSMINHELKTPLVPIKGYSDMLLRPKLIGELNEKQQKAVKSISYNVGKMGLLVSDILDVYKLSLGKLKLSKTEADVTKLIESNVSEFKRLADEKNIVVESHIQYHGKVFCDERRIDQVITNLIKNAIDFVPSNTGKITLCVENDENNIIFSVQDNGSGIPQDKMGKLFQKFYQIDTSMTRKHGSRSVKVL